MTDPRNSPEYTRLWGEWLKTPDGQGYVAGLCDYSNRWHAERGKVWVLERMVERLNEQVESLTMERDTARLDRTACEGRLAAARAEVERITAEGRKT